MTATQTDGPRYGTSGRLCRGLRVDGVVVGHALLLVTDDPAA